MAIPYCWGYCNKGVLQEGLLERGGGYWSAEGVIGARRGLLERGGGYWSAEGVIGTQNPRFSDNCASLHACTLGLHQ
jgi:hypothetical protein